MRINKELTQDNEILGAKTSSSREPLAKEGSGQFILTLETQDCLPSNHFVAADTRSPSKQSQADPRGNGSAFIFKMESKNLEQKINTALSSYSDDDLKVYEKATDHFTEGETYQRYADNLPLRHSLQHDYGCFLVDRYRREKRCNRGYYIYENNN